MPKRGGNFLLHNNNVGEDKLGPPMPKVKRSFFQLPIPKRPEVIGQVLVCGQGDVGQLGLGDDDSKYERKRPAIVEGLNDVVDVQAGGMHNLVLTANGKVYSFGCNDDGALGRDTSEAGTEFEPHEIQLPELAVKISAGDSHSACLLSDGRVYAWGSFRSSHGNIGLTLEGVKRHPISILPDELCCDIASGDQHLVMLTCTGKVYTLGCGEQGQLGRITLRSASGESRRGLTEMLCPAEVVFKKGKRVGHIDAIWTSNFCTFMRDTERTVWAFGLNNYKQLTYSKNAEAVSCPIKTNLRDVKQIAGGQHHTLVLHENGQCFAIGCHNYGRLGLGELSNDVEKLTLIDALKDTQITRIACGDAQSFAITIDGHLYVWGMGSNQQLGRGSDDDVFVPMLLKAPNIQAMPFAVQVSSGGQHTIFLMSSDEKGSATKANKGIPINDKKPV